MEEEILSFSKKKKERKKRNKGREEKLARRWNEWGVAKEKLVSRVVSYFILPTCPGGKGLVTAATART